MSVNPLKSIIRYFLYKYEDKDFILQQKSKVMLTICGIILVFVIPVYLFFAVNFNWSVYSKIPIVFHGSALIIILFILRSGRFFAAAHLFLIITLITLWSYLFLDLHNVNYIERMMSAVLILGLLTFTPLIVDRMTHPMIFYYVINIAALYIFVFLLKNRGDVPDMVLLSFTVDTTITYIMCGAISYQVYTINRVALEKARSAEEQIRKSEELFRGVIEESPQIMAIIGKDGSLDFLGTSNSTIFGYGKEDLPSIDRWWELAYPEEEYRRLIKAEWRLIVENSGEEESLNSIEAKVRSKNGLVQDAMMRYAPLRQSGRGLILIDNITNRKIIERSLLASERRYRKLYDSMLDGFVSLDMDGRIIEFNSAYQQITAFTSEELYSMTIWNLTPQRWHETQRKIIQEQVLARGHSDLFEKEYIRKDGATVPIELRIYLIQDENGNNTGMWSVVHDITKRKQTENELLKTSKIESLGIFAGGIAHDFNNLLTAIMGNISIAKLDLTADSKSYGILCEAEKASERAKDLTMQLLTFSKGGAPIKKIASIRELLIGTADFVLRGSQIKSTFIIPDNLWNAEIDEGQISQVIHNLVLNCREAMPGGGIATITAENRVVAAGDDPSFAPGNYLAIQISDTGYGIPRKHLHKIFDPFFTTKEKGSGLGLSVTYSIVRKHNGYINVESREQNGTCFTVFLPATDLAVAAAAKNQGRADLNGGRALIMDDDEMVLEVGRRILGRLGFETVGASDGKNAIDLYIKAKASGSPFDFVIMDLTVPGGMGGKDAIKLLRDFDPAVKAIVSSGYSIDPVMADFRSFGFSGVVAKPYAIDDLKEVIQSIME
ncbi:MAG: PAS domain S-box protein [Spirochaetes bacterium]|nr:PAS domain S-box protein [Spirochaetota bacterium]